MKRTQVRTSQSSKRARTNEGATAAKSGALAENNASGIVNRELSALPEKELLQAGQVLATAKVTTQAGSLNSAVANTTGLTGQQGITNGAILSDQFNGAIVPDLASLYQAEVQKEENDKLQRKILLTELHKHGELSNAEAYHKLKDMPLETLEAMVAKYAEKDLSEKQGAPQPVFQQVEPDQQLPQPPIIPGKRDDTKEAVQDEKESAGQANDQGPNDAALLATGGQVRARPAALGNPYRTEPDAGFTKVPFDAQRAQDLLNSSQNSTGIIQNPSASGGTDNPNEAKETSELGKGVFEHDLWPYLPAGNPDDVKDDPEERHEKALDVALFNNIFRDPATGDVNLNPLQMGNAIMEGWRYMGDNHVMDPVFPGGELNIGALPATTMRAMPPADTIRDIHAQWTSMRNKKKRHTARDFYQDTRKLAAAAFLEEAQKDIRWINNNQSVRDFQHTSQSNNTMPIEPQWWISRRQDDGEFPLQDNLLPAQALTFSNQIGQGYDAQLISRLYDTEARHDPTFNPPGKMGWLSGVPFA